MLARPLTQKLNEIWGQPVVIDNRPGALGAIAETVQVERGEVTLDLILRGFGSNAPLSTGLGLILASGLDYVVQTPGTTRTAIGTGDNTFTIAMGLAAVHVGDVIAVPPPS